MKPLTRTRPGTTEVKPFRALSCSRKGRVWIVALDGETVCLHR